MPQIKWNTTVEDGQLIDQIVARAEKEGLLWGTPMDLTMDITAVHLNDSALDLPKLLGAPRFDFAHDIGGIQRHVSRKTGKLQNCFLPRCTKQVEAV